MSCRLLSQAAAAALVLFVAACDQGPPSEPQSETPSFRPTTTSVACNFNGNPSVSNAANTYFTVTADKLTASSIISAMQSAFGTSDYAAARPYGFDLLALTGKVSRQGTGSSPADGQALVEQTIQCMFDVDAANDSPTDAFFGWPTDNHFDFASALTPLAGGAFYTRGGLGVPGVDPHADSTTYPVIANLATPASAAGNVSLIAPPTSSDWRTILGQRVLLHGELVYSGTSAIGYDWKVIPRDAVFTPYAIVALCQGLNQTFDDADMVHQDGVGVIGFQDVEDLCTQNVPSLASAGGLWRGFGLVEKLGKFAVRSLTPEPLHATAVTVAFSTIGGSAGGAKGDEFTAENLPTVVLDLEVTDGPRNRVQVNTGRFSATVVVTTPPPDPEPAGGITVKLSVSNNNGNFNGIFEVTDPTYTGCDPQSGKVQVPEKTTILTATQETKVVWNNTLCITQTGAATVNATSEAAGNPNAGIGFDSYTKLNVVP